MNREEMKTKIKDAIIANIKGENDESRDLIKSVIVAKSQAIANPRTEAEAPTDVDPDPATE